jgi:RHS repeat-associated protein
MVVYNLRFPGQYYDVETGLAYNYRRDYDPATGRYIESDPIGLDGGSSSTYIYVDDSPLVGVDPLGLKVMVPAHVAAGVIGHITRPMSFHAALYLDPDDKCECQGNWPMTLGGQPEGGKLVTEENYPSDAISNATVQQVVATPPGMTDCEFINKLIDAAHRYKNDTPYSFPHVSPLPFAVDGQMTSGKYNSNSWVSGVIQAAGGVPPALHAPVYTGGQWPGYQNPLPIPR